ncbi:MAG TPA: hypothetical protein VGN21_03190 [Stellaceae bacterium]|jgi:hypothetical protein
MTRLAPDDRADAAQGIAAENSIIVEHRANAQFVRLGFRKDLAGHSDGAGARLKNSHHRRAGQSV